jgi:hypothetical protein
MTTNVTFNTTSIVTGTPSDNKGSGKFSLKDLKELLALLRQLSPNSKDDTTDESDESSEPGTTDDATAKMLKKLFESLQTGEDTKAHHRKGHHAKGHPANDSTTTQFTI